MTNEEKDLATRVDTMGDGNDSPTAGTNEAPQSLFDLQRENEALKLKLAFYALEKPDGNYAVIFRMIDRWQEQLNGYISSAADRATRRAVGDAYQAVRNEQQAEPDQLGRAWIGIALSAIRRMPIADGAQWSDLLGMEWPDQSKRQEEPTSHV